MVAYKGTGCIRQGSIMPALFNSLTIALTGNVEKYAGAPSSLRAHRQADCLHYLEF